MAQVGYISSQSRPLEMQSQRAPQHGLQFRVALLVQPATTQTWGMAMAEEGWRMFVITEPGKA